MPINMMIWKNNIIQSSFPKLFQEPDIGCGVHCVVLFFKMHVCNQLRSCEKLAFANNLNVGHRLAVQDVNAWKNIILGHGRHIILITKKRVRLYTLFICTFVVITSLSHYIIFVSIICHLVLIEHKQLHEYIKVDDVDLIVDFAYKLSYLSKILF